MPTLAEIRQQYPHYEDMSDKALADALHQKFYSDMPREDFEARVGFSAQPSTAGDVAKSGASGLARGALDLAGLPGTIGDVLDTGGEWLMRQAGLPTRSEAMQERGLDPGSPFSGQKFRQAASAVTGGATEYEPQTTAGRYTGTAAEFLPGAAAFGGLNPANLTRFGLLPGTASEAAGQATEGTAAEPYARVGAALLAPFAPGLASRAVTPMRISPERQQAAQTLQREGVDLTAGQKTGSRGLRYAEGEIGGRRAANIMEGQAEQFTSAILKRAGIDAKRVTPDVIDDAFTRIGKQFDELAENNQLVPDREMITDLRDTFTEYGQLVPESAQAPIVENVTKDIVSAAQRGPIPGKAYQSLRSRLDRAARSNRDPELAQTLRGIRGVLDDAMERSIATNNPSQVGAWRDARNQYRNMLVIERAATGAGEDAAMGLISPSKLRQATVSQGKRAYARGQGDFADLARSGEALMKPLPQSGTAPRLRAQNLGMGLTGMLGAGGGAAMTGNPLGAAIGASAGSALPRLTGAAMMSRPGQAYLSNQMLSGVGLLDPRYAGTVASVLGRSDRNVPAVR